MTVHSELGYYVRGADDRMIDTRGVDAAYSRDLLNNLAHLTDERTQAICKIVLRSGDKLLQSGSFVGGYNLFTQLPPIHFPIAIQPDGSSAHVVTRLTGSISAAGTATFIVRLGWAGAAIGAIGDTTASNVAVVTTTSTSDVELDPDPIYFTAATVAAASRLPRGRGQQPALLPTFDENGDPASVEVHMARLEIWTGTTVVTSVPGVSMVEARQFVGA